MNHDPQIDVIRSQKLSKAAKLVRGRPVTLGTNLKSVCAISLVQLPCDILSELNPGSGPVCWPREVAMIRWLNPGLCPGWDIASFGPR